MLKRRTFLVGALAVSLLMPVSEAKAQGWPTFDVAKLASLITNLVGRFQPVPQVLSRVNQVKTTMSQIQAAGQAAMAGDLKALGQQASGALKSDAFSKKKKNDPVAHAAENSDGAAAASNKVKEIYFAVKGAKPSVEERQKIIQARTELSKAAGDEKIAKSVFLALNAAKMTEERVKKIDEALKNSETIHDSVNANTMLLMANNFEKLNQISLLLTEMQEKTAAQISEVPATGYIKPEQQITDEIKQGTTFESGTLDVKDEIDVDLE